MKPLAMDRSGTRRVPGSARHSLTHSLALVALTAMSSASLPDEARAQALGVRPHIAPLSSSVPAQFSRPPGTPQREFTATGAGSQGIWKWGVNFD